MTKEQFFSGMIRVVFLFAFGAFLSASLPHIATFFHNFEPDNASWISSYALAVSIDATALILTIGVMFFRRNMPRYALVFVWFFIISLTAFSWLVNWEYAMRFQSNDLTVNPTLQLINPILASSFAFLNLAYSLVSEFFSARLETAAELEAEAKRLESLIDVQHRLTLAREQLKKPSLIQRVKETAKEAISAANEIRNEVTIAPDVEADMTANQDANDDDREPEIEENENVYQSSKRDDLGMIERAMYNKVVENQEVLIDLLSLAQTLPISDLTLRLQSRFSSHANYITEARVRHVFEAIQEGYPELLSGRNTGDLEPSTDPEQIAISAANKNGYASQMGSGGTQDFEAEAMQFEQENGSQQDRDFPLNITPILQTNRARIPHDLPGDMGANQGGKKGAYAITKQAAAELLGCPISEIDRGIIEGSIKPFAKDPDKVLRTSVQQFVPRKRSRKTAKVATK